MSALHLIILAVLIWIGLIVLVRVVLFPMLSQAPGLNRFDGLVWYAVRLYCRIVHRSRYEGEQEIREKRQTGGLIIVSNHTSGVDPLLIQAACRFQIRWMMASDMMIPELDWFWSRHQIIPVARDGRDVSAARKAIRHVLEGGVVGIFPEGRIVAHGQIRSFHPGVGLIVHKSKAPVLLVWISGTPETDSMARAFVTPSRARVRFIGILDFREAKDPESITRELRRRLAEVSGWPLDDNPLPSLRQAAKPDPDQEPRLAFVRADHRFIDHDGSMSS